MILSIIGVLYGRKEERKHYILGRIWFSAVGSLFISFVFSIAAYISLNEGRDEWATEVAIPYVNSLEKQRVDIMGVNIDENNYVTVYIKDGKSVKTQSGYYDVETTLKSGEQEYFE